MDSVTVDSMLFIGKLKNYVKERKREYKCTLCKGNFKDPRLLNCYHSFCRFCLDEHLLVSYEDGKFSCPLCKQPNCVPINGARGLPKNYYVDLKEDDKQVNCDVCQINVKAELFCTDCNKCLCKSCLGNHISNNGSQFHNVRGITSNVEKRLVYCSKHKKQELACYCDTCQKPICNSCNVSNHKSHRSKDISGMSVIFKDQLTAAIQDPKLNADVDDCQKKVVGQQRQIRSYQQDVISAIDERTRELHKLVDEVRGEFVRKVVSEDDDSLKQLDYNRKTLNTNVAAIEELVKFGRAFLQQADDLDIVKHVPRILQEIKRLHYIDVKISELKPKIFQALSNESTQTEIQRIFGSFGKHDKRPKEIKSISRLSEFRRTNSDEGRSTEPIRSDPISGVRRNKQSFSCSDAIITAITFFPGGSICICLGGEGILEVFNRDGRRIGRQNFRHPIDDVVADNNGVLYVSTNSERKIYTVVNQNVDTFAETRTCVRGLACDDNGSLITGMTEKSSFFDRHQDGYITEISRDNKIKRVVEDRRIRYPARIAIGHDHCIVVSDWIKLCVVICKREKIIGTYAGSSDLDKEFIPRGICCLSNGDIVAADISSNSLHWLSPDGKLRMIVHVDDEPWSVTADKEDTIWIGTKHGDVIPKELFLPYN